MARIAEMLALPGLVAGIPEADLIACAIALIHEITSTDLLGQNILKLISHAREHLLTPDALSLPERIWADAALATPYRRRPLTMDTTARLDLSALEVMAGTSSFRHKMQPRDCLSEPVRILEIDLRSFPAGARWSETATLTATSAGRVGGVVQWPSFAFPDGTVFDGADPSSCWGRLHHDFARDLDVVPGTEIDILVDAVGTTLAISAIPIE